MTFSILLNLFGRIKMIQITPHMRILVATDPVDFRNYVEFIIMLIHVNIKNIFNTIAISTFVVFSSKPDSQWRITHFG
jgi:hypothetical protein